MLYPIISLFWNPCKKFQYLNTDMATIRAQIWEVLEQVHQLVGKWNNFTVTQLLKRERAQYNDMTIYSPISQ